MSRLVFVGEKPSTTAQQRGWRWEDGRLAAVPLFDALREIGINPTACRFVNLFGKRASNPETPTTASLRELRKMHREGWQLVALGKKVSSALPIDHIAIRHPAARGAGRLRSRYRQHVAEALISRA